jgi:hypothetical protein
VERAVPGELIDEAARHPGAPLLQGVRERAHERDLQVVIGVDRLVTR